MARALPGGLVLSGLASLACGAPAEGPHVSETPTRLEFVREWLRPSLSPETDFVTYPMNFAYDGATRHLFIQDRDTHAIIEVDSSGALVRTFGRAGEGPGEISHSSSIAVRGDHVVAVDNGNLKILVFRRDGSLENEFRIPHFIRDLQILDDGSFLVVPGRAHAVDVLDPDGDALGGVGPPDLLAAGTCTGCAVARLDDGRVVVLDADRLEVYTFDTEGREEARLDLNGMPLMRAWHEELAEQLQRLQKMGGGRSWMQDQVIPVRGTTVLVTVGPPDLVERGQEVWLLDVSSGDVLRYSYARPFVGYRLALDWPRLFTSDLETGAILEYRIPDGE